MSFPGIERLLVDFLTADLAGPRLCTELPANLRDVAPLVQVVRIGGPHDDRDPYLQIPTVSIDCFAADRQAATDLAQAVDVSVRRHLPGAKVLGATVGAVRTLSGPAWRPWDDTSIRRFGATYSFWIKAPSA